MTTAHPSPPGQDAPPQYPWAEWFDGQEWNLVRGRDFWGPPETFRRRLQNAANARRVKVQIRIATDGRFIMVKAVTSA